MSGKVAAAAAGISGVFSADNLSRGNWKNPVILLLRRFGGREMRQRFAARNRILFSLTR